MAPESKKRRPKKKHEASRREVGKGRALELVVARLEAATSGDSAEVRSPEFFTGRDSESQREVDVTVRSKVGSTNVLVMFECRDRVGRNDVRWMDEIAGKRDDVGADVAVAVAAGGGFSEGAKKAAASRGIDLRTVESITVEDVVSWCGLTHLRVQVFETRAQHLDVSTWADTPPIDHATTQDDESGRVDVSLDQPVFTLWDARRIPSPVDPHWVTGKDIHALGMQAYREQQGLPRFSDWTKIAMVMSTQEVPTVAVKTSEGPFPLAGLKAFAEVRVTESEVPVTLCSVTDAAGVTSQVVEAVAEVGDTTCTVSFIKTRDGVSILMAPEESTPDP